MDHFLYEKKGPFWGPFFIQSSSQFQKYGTVFFKFANLMRDNYKKKLFLYVGTYKYIYGARAFLPQKFSPLGFFNPGGTYPPGHFSGL